MPPALLDTRYAWEIDRATLSRLVNSIFTQYKKLNFGVMTPHMAGVHFGAAIESLERAFLKTTTIKVKRTLLTALPCLQITSEG